MRRLS
jgi:hypothetical protein